VRDECSLGADALAAVSGRAWVVGRMGGPDDTNAGRSDDWWARTVAHDLLAAPHPQSGHRFTAGDLLVALDALADEVGGQGIVRALRSCGVAAVVGRSFSRAFCAEAFASGLPALVIEEVGAIRAGDHLRVNVEAHIVANLSSGDRYVIRNIDEQELTRLRRTASVA
jgi:3-isopropylmalate dehydratase small subunit